MKELVSLVELSAPNYLTTFNKNLEFKKELFYVLGALLGDGCAYHWRKGDTKMLVLIGDYNFTKKYTEKLSKCSRNKVKNYIDRNKGVWFVRIGNITLYNLFKEIRLDLNKLADLIKQENSKENSLQLIEGFFDAEGCVKIIKEPVRKTPKICLDITNTNYEILELIRKLLNEKMNIEARYSIQKAFIGKDGSPRQKTYHLRIYKKEYIRQFLENINTTKLKPEKVSYVKNWLNNGK